MGLKGCVWKSRCSTMMNFLDNEPLHVWRISQQPFQSLQIRLACEGFVSGFDTIGYRYDCFYATFFHALLSQKQCFRGAIIMYLYC